MEVNLLQDDMLSDELFTAILLAIRCFDGLSLIACSHDKPKEPQAFQLNRLDHGHVTTLNR